MLLIFLMLLAWAGSSALYILYLPIQNNWFYALWIACGFVTSLVFFVILLLLALLFFRFSKPTNTLKHKILWHYFDFILIFLKIKVEVVGKENIPEHPFCIYANHKSMLDPLILYYVYHTKISAAGKKTLEKVGFMRLLMKAMGAISIDRDNDREAMKAMIDGIKRMNETNMGYIIFPEGGIKTRETEEMVELKPGAYKLATKAGASISPASIIGTSKIAGKKIFRTINVKIVIHKPITKDDYKDLNTTELGEKVFGIVNEGIKDARK